MAILKYSLIGFFVMAVFMFISFFRVEGDYYQERTRAYLESNIEEAAADGAFIMKTYSNGYFDAGDNYRIHIDYGQVIDTFFSSLDFRDFNYQKEDFYLMVFIEYDGVTLYRPAENRLYPKLYYYEEKDGTVIQYFLSELCRVTENGETIWKEADASYKSRSIHKTVEMSINQAAVSGQGEKMEFWLPELEDESGRQMFQDLSFGVFYSGDHYYGLGFDRFETIHPSGIMKMEELPGY